MNTKGWAGDIQCDDNPSSICGLEISFVSADIQDIDIKLIPVNQFCNINNPGTFAAWDNTQDLRIIQSKGKTELSSVRLGLDIKIKATVGPIIQTINFNTSASSYLARSIISVKRLEPDEGCQASCPA